MKNLKTKTAASTFIKKQKLGIRHTAVSVALLFASAVITPLASAYTVYSLAENYYAIVCTDGQIFSYSGGPSGIGIVAPALCEGHGGIAGGPGGGVNVSAAPAELSQSVSTCQNGAGKTIDAHTTQCHRRIKVNRLSMSSPQVRPAPKTLSPQGSAR